MDFATTNTTYVYDGMGRLTNEYIGDKSIAYYYDANGNRTLMNNDGNITSYTYDKNNRLLTESANGETITYTYDANGNTLTAGDKSYTYDYRGQQICYSDETTYAAYTYNPSGLRSVKTVGGSTKYFVYNGMQIVFEYEDSVSDGTTYYYGLNRTHSSDGDIFVYNAHGDTVQLVNNNAVAASYTYDAFGNLTNTVGTSDNAFLYCSEYFDQETQTYYLRARYYNPANGRFTQQDAWAFMDPTDPLILNLYTYCANNPVLYVDPWGTSFVLAFLATVAIGAAVSAAIDAGTQLINNGGNVKNINWRSVGASAVSGAVTSGMAFMTGGVSLGLYGTMVAGAMIGASGYLTYNLVNGTESTLTGLLFAAEFGGLLSGVTYKIGHPSYGKKGSVNALDNANYAQSTYSEKFSKEGSRIYSDLAGRPIKTVTDLAAAIKDGTIPVSNLDVQYIIRDGHTLILNTRTSQALSQAGIPRSQWSTVNVTGQAQFEEMLTNQLARNNLTVAGTSTVIRK